MKNVSNKDKCCDNRSKKKNHTELSCPINGEKGQSVSSKTIRHMIKKEGLADLYDKGYFFCRASNCSTVYYHPESGQTFSKKDLKVRVGLKETADPIWVCYCFDISKRMIQEEITSKGRSSLRDRIRQEIADGNCDCESVNPSGRCCLGDVIAAEEEALKTIVDNE